MRGPATRGVGRRQRHLLADDRRQVAVEGEHELLELPALRVAGPSKPTRSVVEDGRLQEAEDRVDAAVVQEAEAADLIALVAVVAGVRGTAIAGMPNMPTFWYMFRRCGTLKICVLVLEARVAVGAEEALRSDRARGSRCS